MNMLYIIMALETGFSPLTYDNYFMAQIDAEINQMVFVNVEAKSFLRLTEMPYVKGSIGLTVEIARLWVEYKIPIIDGDKEFNICTRFQIEGDVLKRRR